MMGMKLDDADPDDVVIADVNERSEARMISGLQQNVAKRGVLQPPLVRRTDDAEARFECVAGGRRVIAAQRAHLDALPVLVVEWSDAEALAASISENGGVFRESVSAQDRALALGRLWDLLGGEGPPSAGPLAERLGAPRETVVQWLEPLRREWENTPVAPGGNGSGGGSEDDDSENGSDRPDDGPISERGDGVRHHVTDSGGEHEKGGDGDDTLEQLDIGAVGERNLREIRLATGGGEAGVALAREVADGALGRDDLREIKDRTRRGESVPDATAAVKRDDSADDPNESGAVTMDPPADTTDETDETRAPITVEVSFTGEAATALEAAATATVRDEAETVELATVEHLTREGWFE